MCEHVGVGAVEITIQIVQLGVSDGDGTAGRTQNARKDVDVPQQNEIPLRLHRHQRSYQAIRQSGIKTYIVFQHDQNIVLTGPLRKDFPDGIMTQVTGDGVGRVQMTSIANQWSVFYIPAHTHRGVFQHDLAVTRIAVDGRKPLDRDVEIQGGQSGPHVRLTMNGTVQIDTDHQHAIKNHV